jgi:phosphoglucosamine mutase
LKNKIKTKKSGILFGTDGIRGCANKHPMTVEMVLKIGQALGIFFKNKYENPRILIAKDTRRSGYLLEQALSAGICSIGVNTYFLGPIPTPGIAYMTRGMRATAGIMLSASHNPFEDNGLKVFSADGFKLSDDIEQKLEQLILRGVQDYDFPYGAEVGVSSRINDAVGQYAVFLKEQFPKHLSLDGLRIVIDCANGAAYKVAPKVLRELGADLFTINDQPNGVNINLGCGALYPQSLSQKVKLYKADLGLAFDGDADRLICVDEKGEILDGDEFLAVCACDYIKTGRLKNKTLITTVMSNMGLDVAVKRAGGKVIRTEVGDRAVMEAMLKNDCNLGGEQSGHFIFKDSSTTGDGVLAALVLLEIILTRKKPLSELRKVITKIPQVLNNIKVPAKVALDKLPTLKKMVESYNKELAPTGRVMFRYSGTESKARVMIEGEDLSKIQSYADEISSACKVQVEDYYTKHIESQKNA